MKKIIWLMALLLISSMIMAHNRFFIVADETCKSAECLQKCDFTNIDVALRVLGSEDLIEMYPSGVQVCVGTLRGDKPKDNDIFDNTCMSTKKKASVGFLFILGAIIIINFVILIVTWIREGWSVTVNFDTSFKEKLRVIWGYIWGVLLMFLITAALIFACYWICVLGGQILCWLGWI